MRLRSKPVTVRPIRNPSGTISYRVLGTLQPKGRQRKEHCESLEEALAVQAAWEAERLAVRASLRPKITRLTQQQLAQAEAAVEILKGTGITIVEAARHALRSPPAKASDLALQSALEAFLVERKPFVGPAQFENLRLTGYSFARYAGAKKPLCDVSTAQVQQWLAAKGKIAKKTWNNYRNDLSTFFEWCTVKPRGWVPDNPVKPIPQHEIVRSLPERLEISTAEWLMAELEVRHPEWCLFFALALFLGVRPDMTCGEMSKLAEVVRRDGVKKYFCNGVLHITAEVAKDKRPRQTQIPPNVADWIERYPASSEAICPADWACYGRIRKRFGIPHDGLRHTAISAHVSLHGSFADSAMQFGNSERMIRTHYFNRMTKEEAQRFYAIRPRRLAAPGNDSSNSGERSKPSDGRCFARSASPVAA